MPLGIIVLLFGVVGYIADFLEKEKKKQNRHQNTFSKQQNQATQTKLIHPITKKTVNTMLLGVFNNVFDATTQQKNTTLKRNADKQKKVEHDMSSYEEEVYEDEESFETELTTPMSMAIDENPLYSDSEWEAIAQTQNDIKVIKPNKANLRKKRGALQRAYINSEVFGKPKGLE